MSSTCSDDDQRDVTDLRFYELLNKSKGYKDELGIVF